MFDCAWYENSIRECRRSLPSGVQLVISRKRMIWCLNYWSKSGWLISTEPGIGWVHGNHAWSTYFWNKVSVVMKKKQRPMDLSGERSAMPCDLVEQYPLLLEHLTHTTYDDGSPRDTSTLLVTTGDGMWKCMLKDRQEGLVLWVSAPTLTQALQLLDDCCGSDDTHWRRDTFAQQTQKKKK